MKKSNKKLYLSLSKKKQNKKLYSFGRLVRLKRRRKRTVLKKTHLSLTSRLRRKSKKFLKANNSIRITKERHHDLKPKISMMTSKQLVKELLKKGQEENHEE